LLVVFVSGVRVSLELVEEAGLELVADEQVEVGRLVQEVAMTLHIADFL
jgi:hypothetical protein